MVQFSSVQSLTCVWLFATTWTVEQQTSLSITNSGVYSQTHVHWVSDAIQPSLPLASTSPPKFNLSPDQGLFKWVSSSHQVAKVLDFQLQLDLLAVQGTLKSVLQNHSSKASIFWCSAFFIVQLSHPYMTTGKTIALTRLAFVGKVMSLLFNMLSRSVITFLLNLN